MVDWMYSGMGFLPRMFKLEWGRKGGKHHGQEHQAERASIGHRKVSPMQLAAQILENALSEIPE